MLKRDRSNAKIIKAVAVVDQDMRRDRFGYNNQGAVPHYSRITYLAHAKGYVMAHAVCDIGEVVALVPVLDGGIVAAPIVAGAG